MDDMFQLSSTDTSTSRPDPHSEEEAIDVLNEEESVDDLEDEFVFAVDDADVSHRQPDADEVSLYSDAMSRKASIVRLSECMNE
jgi:hypothetical protein